MLAHPAEGVGVEGGQRRLDTAQVGTAGGGNALPLPLQGGEFGADGGAGLDDRAGAQHVPQVFAGAFPVVHAAGVVAHVAGVRAAQPLAVVEDHRAQPHTGGGLEETAALHIFIIARIAGIDALLGAHLQFDREFAAADQLSFGPERAVEPGGGVGGRDAQALLEPPERAVVDVRDQRQPPQRHEAPVAAEGGGQRTGGLRCGLRRGRCRRG
ncbi:hypothetical protein [Spongiactinospora sp. TRM90649]|uniref:hypothetical protein n=1 Tax=Spongiactinospora sp. TRM90649 TaxID=3031114 RepID=UPI0023F814D2|nr:hypothetical protein [Spongiactinospora sp. TRM90649]MDF5757510.1 hypothetical protein [Spongiactinospora sp. TRM90649]